MTATNTNPLDQNPSRRPLLSDFNDAQKEDDTEFEPNPVTDPNATEWNLLSRLAVAAGSMMPTLLVHVRMVAGAPTLEAFWAASTVTESSNLHLTDNGTGDTTIAWDTAADGALPPTAGPAFVTVLSDSLAITRALRPTPGSVRVKAVNASGTGVDVDFAVAIW